MSTTSAQLTQLLDSDKTAALINTHLDELDANLMKQGQQAKSMHGHYQNTLFQYLSVLSTLATNPCDRATHTPCMKVDKLFTPLIKYSASESYKEAITKVRETLASRINYFTGLTRALPIGRLSYPVDVAWFHRTNNKLIQEYQSQHPINKELLLVEETAIKEQCDFRELKLDVVKQVRTATDFLYHRTEPFFKPGDDIHYQVSNYFRHHLYEPLTRLADDITLTNAPAYLQALSEIQKRFQLGLRNVDPNIKDNSLITVSEKALALINTLTKEKLIPLLDSINDQFNPLELRFIKISL